MARIWRGKLMDHPNDPAQRNRMPNPAHLTPGDEATPTLHPLDEAELEALDALVNALVALDVSVPNSARFDGPVELLASLYREPRPLLEAMRAVAHEVVARALSGGEPPDRERLGHEVRRLDESRIALLGEPDPVPLPPDLRDVFLMDAAELIREVGLEVFDASVLLARGKDDRLHLAGDRVPPETALIWLQGRLFDRLEAVALSDPLLEIERRASRWAFERWSAPLAIGDREAAAFTQGVREREWSFVDRESALFGTPPVHALCEQPLFEKLPPKQQRLARALRGSFVGVFTVLSHQDDEVELEGALDGRRYRVHEHNSEVRYDAGFIAIGRLIPLGGGRWLRSPGMLIFSSPGNVTARDLAEGFEKIPALAPALIAEGIIAGVAGRGRVPRDVPPADSPAEAKDLLHAVGEALDAHGLRRVLPKDEAPPELRAADGEREFYVYEVDDDLAAWIEALGKLARRAPSRGGRAGRRAKARKKKGRGKRR